MRRLFLVLVAALRFCSARQRQFNIHDDLLAYPQFDIVFANSYISEADALALLASAPRPPGPTGAASNRPATDLARDIRGSPKAGAKQKGEHTEQGSADSGSATGSSRSATTGGDDSDIDDDDAPQISETYELIHAPPSRYLCAVPVLAPPPAQNQTATELAKPEEARKLTRASARGWELLRGLDGKCLYFVSGWWSYSFCYGADIVQFHALPGNQMGEPPLRDPHTQDYVLGRTLADEDHPQPKRKRQQQQEQLGDDSSLAHHQHDDGEPAKSLARTELQVKGDQRYLVQRLNGGTICDLVGRERTIEVQFHCVPGVPHDRIGWIKEVTTCAYLMMVQTPRLCADSAFLPPRETRAHPIRCQQIVSTNQEAHAWGRSQPDQRNTIEAEAGQLQQSQGAAHNQHSQHHLGKTIGGVVVGGRQVLGGGTGNGGKASPKLPPHRPMVGGRFTGFEQFQQQRQQHLQRQQQQQQQQQNEQPQHQQQDQNPQQGETAAGSSKEADHAMMEAEIAELLANWQKWALGGDASGKDGQSTNNKDGAERGEDVSSSDEGGSVAVDELKRQLKELTSRHGWQVEEWETPGEAEDALFVVVETEEDEGGYAERADAAREERGRKEEAQQGPEGAGDDDGPPQQAGSVEEGGYDDL